MSSLSQPVTVHIDRIIKPGNEGKYEAWVHQGTKLVCQYPGFLGMDLKRPEAPANNNYHLSYKFDSAEHQNAWEISPIRSRHMDAVKRFLIGGGKYTRVQEKTLTIESRQKPEKQPNPHKMALVLTIVVFSILYPVNLVFGPYLQELPLIVKVFSIVLCQVALMTYFIMPPLMRRLHPWLIK